MKPERVKNTALARFFAEWQRWCSYASIEDREKALKSLLHKELNDQFYEFRIPPV